MDIQAGTIAIVGLLFVFAFLAIRSGLRTIQAARRMTFYHLRRQRESAGWRRLGLAVLLLLVAVALPIYGLPIAYEYFPPSPTPSLTPTITPIPSITQPPTITLSPTVTDTPVESATPTASATPHVPEAIEALFEGSVTPNPEVEFSPPEFTTQGGSYPPEQTSTVFQNPVGHMYGVFTYDGMLPGVQWTALWFRQGELVYYESYPWDGGTGGAYYTEWNPSPDQWIPAIYTVQLFVGDQFIVSGRFLVEGSAPTAVPSGTPSATPRHTATAVTSPAPPATAALSGSTVQTGAPTP